MARVFRHRRELAQLLALGDTGGMCQTLRDRPRVIGIAEWPYLHRGWGVKERVRAIREHYAAVAGLGWLQPRVGEERDLAKLGDVFEGLRVVLDRPEWFIREGELTLNLFLGEERVYSIAFSLSGSAAGRTAVVGAIQGRNLGHIQATYKQLTKALEGMRPRDFLILCLQMTCEVAGVSRILAVADENRHHRHPYFAGKGQQASGTPYDEIWKDRGGAPAELGFFELPVRPAPRPESTIPPQKRPMYRRRAALQERVRNEIERAAHGAAMAEQTG
jgi:uncharacterized protein VirK/YbjX